MSGRPDGFDIHKGQPRRLSRSQPLPPMGHAASQQSLPMLQPGHGLGQAMMQPPPPWMQPPHPMLPAQLPQHYQSPGLQLHQRPMQQPPHQPPPPMMVAPPPFQPHQHQNPVQPSQPLSSHFASGNLSGTSSSQPGPFPALRPDSGHTAGKAKHSGQKQRSSPYIKSGADQAKQKKNKPDSSAPAVRASGQAARIRQQREQQIHFSVSEVEDSDGFSSSDEFHEVSIHSQRAPKARHTTLKASDQNIKGDELIALTHRAVQDAIARAKKPTSRVVVSGQDWLGTAGTMALYPAKGDIGAGSLKATYPSKWISDSRNGDKPISIGRGQTQMLVQNRGKTERLAPQSDPKADHSYKQTVQHIKQITTKHDIEDAVLARRLLQKYKTGIDFEDFAPPENQYLDFLNTLFFGVEASRNNTSFATSLMTLEMIAGGRLSFHKALDQDEFGGLYPMASLKSGTGNLSEHGKMIAKAQSGQVSGMKGVRAAPQHQAVSYKEAAIIKNWLRAKGLYRKDMSREQALQHIRQAVNALLEDYNFGTESAPQAPAQPLPPLPPHQLVEAGFNQFDMPGGELACAPMSVMGIAAVLNSQGQPQPEDLVNSLTQGMAIYQTMLNEAAHEALLIQEPAAQEPEDPGDYPPPPVIGRLPPISEDPESSDDSGDSPDWGMAQDHVQSSSPGQIQLSPWEHSDADISFHDSPRLPAAWEAPDTLMSLHARPNSSDEPAPFQQSASGPEFDGLDNFSAFAWDDSSPLDFPPADFGDFGAEPDALVSLGAFGADSGPEWDPEPEDVLESSVDQPLNGLNLHHFNPAEVLPQDAAAVGLLHGDNLTVPFVGDQVEQAIANSLAKAPRCGVAIVMGDASLSVTRYDDRYVVYDSHGYDGVSSSAFTARHDSMAAANQMIRHMLLTRVAPGQDVSLTEFFSPQHNLPQQD